MPYRNKHNLSRNIPSDVKREIRQRCGFGCVVCGLGIFDYEHFDPEFKDAKKHDSSGMTLLCMQCNQKKRRGLLSLETVAQANKNPKCKEAGFSNECFDFGTKPIEIELAGVRFTNCTHLIAIDDYPILTISAPDHSNSHYRLSGLFADETGATTLKIDENNWIAGADNWDVEWTGPSLTIRRGLGEIALRLIAKPPSSIAITKLNMNYGGVHLRGNDRKLEHSFDGQNWSELGNVSISNHYIAIAFRSKT